MKYGISLAPAAAGNFSGSRFILHKSEQTDRLTVYKPQVKFWMVQLALSPSHPSLFQTQSGRVKWEQHRIALRVVEGSCLGNQKTFIEFVAIDEERHGSLFFFFVVISPPPFFWLASPDVAPQREVLTGSPAWRPAFQPCPLSSPPLSTCDCQSWLMFGEGLKILPTLWHRRLWLFCEQSVLCNTYPLTPVDRLLSLRVSLCLCVRLDKGVPIYFALNRPSLLSVCFQHCLSHTQLTMPFCIHTSLLVTRSVVLFVC